MKTTTTIRLGLLPTLCLALLCSCGEPIRNDDFPRLTGDYFGQTPPGPQAELFAPGLISTGLVDRDMAMTPDGDEMYFSVATPNYGFSAIVATRRVGGVWTRPEVASFCRNPEWSAVEPFISPDGQRFYFISDRPDGPDDDSEDDDIWIMDREEDGWGEPYNAGAPVNSEASEYFPSVTRDGTLYFSRADPRTRIHNIYRSRRIDGRYQEPELLPAEVNSGRSQFNAFVAPDESYIIVPVIGREDTRGGVDQYISFRDELDHWNGPYNLGDEVNSPAMNEWSSYVTPDGRYLFFMSNRQPDLDPSAPIDYGRMLADYDAPRNGNADIYWVDASFIEAMRTQALADNATQEAHHE